MLKSGNREDEEKTEKTETSTETVTQEKKVEVPPFRKPFSTIQKNLKVTSIRETLEKNKLTTSQDTSIDTDRQTDSQKSDTNQPAMEKEQTIVSEEQTATSEQGVESENKTDNDTITSKQQQETDYVTLEDCWIASVQEVSDKNPLAQELFSKQIPDATEDHVIEIEVPNEVVKQGIKYLIPVLTNALLQKTGVRYFISLKVIKVVQEKQVDRTNPDEKFKHLCQENPKLLDFKQRLNLSIS